MRTQHNPQDYSQQISFNQHSLHPFRYLKQSESPIPRNPRQYQYSYLAAPQKQNTSTQNQNMPRQSISPSVYHAKSTSSTNQQTHPKSSTDNLHIVRLQSQILDLQRIVDQQTYQLETLTQQSTHFLQICQSQKEVIIQLNAEAVKMEYEEQIRELLKERERVQEIIVQLRQDYNDVYQREEQDLNCMRDRNEEISKAIQQELEKKKILLGMIGNKDKQLMELQIDGREAEERIDELRNIERKLTIALRELQMLKSESENNSQKTQTKKETRIESKLYSISEQQQIQKPLSSGRQRSIGKHQQMESEQSHLQTRTNAYRYEQNNKKTQRYSYLQQNDEQYLNIDSPERRQRKSMPKEQLKGWIKSSHNRKPTQI